jgi:hypothetical protein
MQGTRVVLSTTFEAGHAQLTDNYFYSLDRLAICLFAKKQIHCYKNN